LKNIWFNEEVSEHAVLICCRNLGNLEDRRCMNNMNELQQSGMKDDYDHYHNSNNNNILVKF
jgi:hypothetical protein